MIRVLFLALTLPIFLNAQEVTYAQCELVDVPVFDEYSVDGMTLEQALDKLQKDTETLYQHGRSTGELPYFNIFWISEPTEELIHYEGSGVNVIEALEGVLEKFGGKYCITDSHCVWVGADLEMVEEARSGAPAVLNGVVIPKFFYHSDFEAFKGAFTKLAHEYAVDSSNPSWHMELDIYSKRSIKSSWRHVKAMDVLAYLMLVANTRSYETKTIYRISDSSSKVFQLTIYQLHCGIEDGSHLELPTDITEFRALLPKLDVAVMAEIKMPLGVRVMGDQKYTLFDWPNYYFAENSDTPYILGSKPIYGGLVLNGMIQQAGSDAYRLELEYDFEQKISWSVGSNSPQYEHIGGYAEITLPLNQVYSTPCADDLTMVYILEPLFGN